MVHSAQLSFFQENPHVYFVEGFVVVSCIALVEQLGDDSCVMYGTG